MPQLIDLVVNPTLAKRRPAKLKASTRPHPTAPPKRPQPERPFANPPQRHVWSSRHPRLHRLSRLLLLPAIIAGGAVAGIVIQSAVVGQAVLALYAIVALIFRIESKLTFTIAFLMLCVMVGMLLFYTNSTLATNFAIYTFILLIIGVVSLLREVGERYA